MIWLMLRRITIAIIVVGAVAAVAFFMHHPISPGPTGDLRFDPNTSAAWPANQTYTWSFRLPDDIGDREGLSLQTRRNSTTVPAGKSPAFDQYSVEMPASESLDADSISGGIVLGKSDRYPRSGTATATATVQLIDLSDIGAVSSVPGANLRIIANLDYYGARIGLPGDNPIFLPPGRFVCRMWQTQGRWSNNNLYLMSFYIQDRQTLWKYDVFIAHRPLLAASSATRAAADTR